MTNTSTIYIDFDGVILDSEEAMLRRKEDLGFTSYDFSQFEAYFNYTKKHPEEWDNIIRTANSINNSVEIIKELEKMKKRIAILTKIHTLHEMKVKIDDLRNHRDIKSPVIFVPPGIEKYQIIIPDNQILIDDMEKNIYGWIENGGRGYIFDKEISYNHGNKVRSLEFLLKK